MLYISFYGILFLFKGSPFQCAALATDDFDVRAKFNDVARFLTERPVDEVWVGSSLPVFCCSPYAVSIKSTIKILQIEEYILDDILLGYFLRLLTQISASVLMKHKYIIVKSIFCILHNLREKNA